MPTIGRKRGVKRYGTSHGIRFDQTMETILRSYAGRAGVTLTDAVRLLLDQAIGGRVNAVDEQAHRLESIHKWVEQTKIDLNLLAAGLGNQRVLTHERLVRLEAKVDLLAEEQLYAHRMGQELHTKVDTALLLLREWGEQDEPDDMAVLAEDVPPEPYWEPPVYLEGSGWER